MHWFRKNIWVGSRAALLALAIQFIFSFAHVHPDFSSTESPAVGVLANSGHDHGGSPAAPSSKHDPFCAVCVLIQMAAATVAAAAPVLDVPQWFDCSLANPTVCLRLFAVP